MSMRPNPKLSSDQVPLDLEKQCHSMKSPKSQYRRFRKSVLDPESEALPIKPPQRWFLKISPPNTVNNDDVKYSCCIDNTKYTYELQFAYDYNKSNAKFV